MFYRVYINQPGAAAILQKEYGCSYTQCADNLWDLGIWSEEDLQEMSNNEWWWVRSYIDKLEVSK